MPFGEAVPAQIKRRSDASGSGIAKQDRRVVAKEEEGEGAGDVEMVEPGRQGELSECAGAGSVA